jgi:hypothetical protein
MYFTNTVAELVHQNINKESYNNFFIIIILIYIFLKSIIVYRHTGCGTCQDSRYNIVIREYYTLHIDKDTYYVSRYNIDTYYVSKYSIVKHECYTLHIDIYTYYVNGSGII